MAELLPLTVYQFTSKESLTRLLDIMNCLLQSKFKIWESEKNSVFILKEGPVIFKRGTGAMYPE